MSAFDATYDDFVQATSALGVIDENDLAPDNMDVLKAGFGTLFREETLVSGIRNLSEQEDQRIKTISDLTGEDQERSLFKWRGVPAKRRSFYTELYDNGDLSLDPAGNILVSDEYKGLGFETATGVKEGLMLRQFQSRYPGKFKSDQEIESFIKRDLAEKRAADMAVLERSSGFVAGSFELAGAAGAAMTDPLNIATLPMGISFLKTTGPIVINFIKAFSTEAVIGATTEALIQGEVVEYKRRIDSPYSVKQAAYNILAAGVGAGAIRGVGSVTIDTAARLLNKYKSGKSAGTIKPNAETEQAADVLEQIVTEGNKSPLRKGTEAAEKAHFDAATKAANDIEQGKPVNVSKITQDYEVIPEQAADIPDSIIEKYNRDIVELFSDQGEVARVEGFESQLNKLIEENLLTRGQKNELRGIEKKLELDLDQAQKQQIDPNQVAVRKQELIEQGLIGRIAKKQAKLDIQKKIDDQVTAVKDRLRGVKERLKTHHNAMTARNSSIKLKAAREKSIALGNVSRGTIKKKAVIKKKAEPVKAEKPTVIPAERLTPDDPLTAQRAGLDVASDQDMDLAIRDAQNMLDETGGDVELPERIIIEGSDKVMETKGMRQTFDELDAQTKAIDEIITCGTG